MKTLLFATVLFPGHLFACMNAGHPEPTSRYVVDHHLVTNLRLMMAKDSRQVKAADKFGKSKSLHKMRELQALDLILQGQPQAALPILQELEKTSESRYNSAANMGTAYELMGDNVNALRWIKVGIQRNSSSHYGTEWLHALILEAKVKAGAHPEAPLKSRLIELPENIEYETRIKVGRHDLSAWDLHHALTYQLHERLLFVKPHDPYVADLLFSFAEIEYHLGTSENALGLVSMAREYGFPDDALLRQHERKYWFAAVTGLVIHWGRWIPLVLLPILLPFWIKLKLSQPESWMYWAWQRCKPWLTAPISFRSPARPA